MENYPCRDGTGGRERKLRWSEGRWIRADRSSEDGSGQMDRVKMEQMDQRKMERGNGVQWRSSEKIDWDGWIAVGKKGRGRNSSLVNLWLYLWRGSRKVKEV